MVETNGTHSEYDRYKVLMTSERRKLLKAKEGIGE
jgi:hypothetical protein